MKWNLIMVLYTFISKLNNSPNQNEIFFFSLNQNKDRKNSADLYLLTCCRKNLFHKFRQTWKKLPQIDVKKICQKFFFL